MAEPASVDMWQPVRLSDLLAALLACLEGAHLQAYPDSGGVWTIGIGSTRDVTPGMVITPQQMAERFAVDSAHLITALAGKPILEAAALGSFGFNCGLSGLLKVLSGVDTIANPKHATDRTGETRSGLVMRRHLEQTLIALSQQINPRPTVT